MFPKYSIANYKSKKKILPVGAGFSMRMDGRTDRQRGMTKLIVALLNFANATKNPSCGSRGFHAHGRTN